MSHLITALRAELPLEGKPEFPPQRSVTPLKKYYADKTCLNLLRVLILILTVGLIVAAYYFLRPIPILMWILIGIFSAIYFFVGILWLPLYFSRASYLVSSQEIIRNTGFFWHMQQVMKVPAIQYATLITTPLSKYTGLNFIVVNALGGSMLLLFLSGKDAEEILRTLSSAMKHS